MGELIDFPSRKEIKTGDKKPDCVFFSIAKKFAYWFEIIQGVKYLIDSLVEIEKIERDKKG